MVDCDCKEISSLNEMSRVTRLLNVGIHRYYYDTENKPVY